MPSTVRPHGRVRQRFLYAPRTGCRCASAPTGTPRSAAFDRGEHPVDARQSRGRLTRSAARAGARPSSADAEPELFVRGRRVTEADVIDALTMLGDEEVQAYHEGRLPKAEAYRIAHHRLRTLARMTAW